MKFKSQITSYDPYGYNLVKKDQEYEIIHHNLISITIDKGELFKKDYERYVQIYFSEFVFTTLNTVENILPKEDLMFLKLKGYFKR